MGKLSENGERVLVYVSGPSPGFVTCYSFIINKRGDLGPETKRSAETAGVGLYCLRAAVVLAADTGKINSEMLNVGRAGVLFFMF